MHVDLHIYDTGQYNDDDNTSTQYLTRQRKPQDASLVSLRLVMPLSNT